MLPLHSGAVEVHAYLLMLCSRSSLIPRLTAVILMLQDLT